MLNIARGLADCAIMKYFRVELFYPINLIILLIITIEVALNLLVKACNSKFKANKKTYC